MQVAVDSISNGAEARAASVIQEEVTRAMDARGMTYYEACRRLGLQSVSRVHWLRHRIRHWPEPELFRALCRELDLEPQDLLREAGYLD